MKRLKGDPRPIRPDRCPCCGGKPAPFYITNLPLCYACGSVTRVIKWLVENGVLRMQAPGPDPRQLPLPLAESAPTPSPEQVNQDLGLKTRAEFLQAAGALVPETSPS